MARIPLVKNVKCAAIKMEPVRNEVGSKMFGTNSLDRRNFGSKQHGTVLLLASPKKCTAGYKLSGINSIELSVGSERICVFTPSK